MRIFIPSPSSLGDQWKSIGLLLQLAERENNIIQLSGRIGDKDIGAKQREILGVLDARVDLLEISAYPGNTVIPMDSIRISRSLRTKTVWIWSRSTRYVAYQFDGVSSSTAKNIPMIGQERVLSRLTREGYVPRRLGRHITLSEAVTQLSESAFFVGCDSGFSHVAHSVGTPVFLLQHKKPVADWHMGQAYTLCDGADDFIDHRLPAWLTYRKFLGLH